MLPVHRMWFPTLMLLCSAILAACGVAPQAGQNFVQPTATPRPIATTLPTATPRPTSTSVPTRAAVPSASAAPPVTAGATAHANADPIAEMLQALNRRRSEYGCTNLTIDEPLQAAAQNHANDLAQRKQVDHRGADGASLEQRLERVGYAFARRSETIAVGYDTSPQAIVDIWLDEPPDGPHRSTVLNCAYPDVGVGAARVDETITYWVVDYAQPQTP